jgi:signal transduction histidine kinase/DNA-binding response OmpR family regulator
LVVSTSSGEISSLFEQMLAVASLQFSSGSLIAYEDDEIGALAVGLDMLSEELEAKMSALTEARDEALQAARAKEEFLRNITHELRTPLTAIMGMTERCLDSVLTAEQREYLEVSKTALDSLLGLVNDLLDYSKLDAGKMRLEMIPFRLEDVINETVRTMSERARKKGLDLRYAIEPEVPEELVGDPGRLRQVLFNVTGNAVKFTQVGVVSIHVSKLETLGGDILLRFSIADTGMGIQEDLQQAIFEPFTQADGSTSRKFGGTGLGLAISREIVDAMGGEMSVSSQLGVGSEFVFTGRFQSLETPSALQGVETLSLTEESVLVMTDDAATEQALTQLLNSASITPVVVADLEKALALLDESAEAAVRPRAVIVRLSIDSVATCEAIAGHATGASVPVVAITESGKRGDAARYRSAGAAAYLVEPISTLDILEAMRLSVALALGEGEPPLITRHVLRELRASHHILVVDDSPTNQAVTKRLLESRGHSVTLARDGLEAVSAVEHEVFDAVLMDAEMPNMDGLEATIAIRRHESPGGRHLPIVALTVLATIEDRDRCIEAGADAWISKPFSSDELLGIVEELAARFG